MQVWGLTLYRRIVDDHYEHGLRLFQETQTGVIRLQASVQTGEIKRQAVSKLPNPHPVIASVLITHETQKTDLDGVHHSSNHFLYLDVSR